MPAAAATYYVDRGNPSCVNSGAGAGTAAQPYCTISAAVAARAAAGNTILVSPGIYPEQVTINASGASGSPLVLQAPASGVVIDGADDFAVASNWTLAFGDVWLAPTVTWHPKQVFLDGTRADSSTVDPAALPARSFRWVAGAGLYVNAGGGNPGAHQARVGHRNYGLSLFGRSWITIDGLAVTRTEDRGVYLNGSCTNVTIVRDTVTLAAKMGIQIVGGSGIRVSASSIHDNYDHGIALIGGATACTIEDSECYNNARPTDRLANGIYLFNSPGNTIRRNRAHHNADTGIHVQSGSNNCIEYLNRSWSNGDHGYDHLGATGTLHIGDVAYGNYRDGFSIEGAANGTQLYDCIATDNGLTTNEFDLWVDGGSSAGFVSDYNIFWNSTQQAPIKYVAFTPYATIAAYSAASGQDTHSIQADPQFVSPPAGDFHLLAGSPAIDAANSGVPSWPEADADNQARLDDPGTTNTGIGPIDYGDRGAYEFRPANPPPVARLTITPSSGSAPLPALADGSSSSDDGTIVSYRFDFGDGTIVGPQASASASHTYAGGDWTCTLQVTDNGGLTGSTTAPIHVSANQAPDGVIGTPAGPVTIVAGQALSFTGSGTDPDHDLPLGYAWNFGGGAASSTLQNPGPVSFATAGTYTVTLTVTDGLGIADPTPDTRVITVNPSSALGCPDNRVTNPSFETDTQGWSGQSCTLTRVAGGAGGSYSCLARSSGTSGFFAQGSPSWIAPTTAGATYHFGVAARSDSAHGLVMIRIFEYANGTKVGQLDSPAVTLSPAWQRLDADYTVSQTGSVIYFTVRDNPVAAAESFNLDDAFVCPPGGPPPDQAPNGVISAPGAGVGITAGQSVNFTGAGTDPDNHLPLTYLWDFGGGATNTTQQNPGDVMFANPGTYTVTFTATDALGLADPTPDSRIITVYAAGGCPASLLPNPSFETDVTGWKGIGATIARVAGGSSGSFSCRVTSPASTSAFYVEDSPRTVGSTTAGVGYHFGASVRSDAAHGVCRIRIMEYLNNTKVGELDSPVVTLSPSWQRLEVSYTPVQTGSALYFTVKDNPVVAAEAFDVDDCSYCPLARSTASAAQVKAASAEMEEAVAFGARIRSLVAPNPVVGASLLKFSTLRSGPLHVAIFDVSGRRVRALADDSQSPAGFHALLLDERGDHGARLDSGVYFYRIRSADGLEQGRFLIMH